MNHVVLNQLKNLEALIVFVDDSKKILGSLKDKALLEYIQLVLKKDFSGKWKESLILYTPGHPSTQRICLIGAGSRQALSAQKFRILGAKCVQAAQERNLKDNVAILLPSLPKLKSSEILEALEIGSRVFQFRYHEMKRSQTKKPEASKELHFQFFSSEARETKSLLRAENRAAAVSSGVNFARYLISMSPRQLTPKVLGEMAQKISRSSKSKSKIKSTVWTEKELSKNSYEGILAVGQGSDNPPRLIQLEYWGARKTEKPVVLVGKGITFDSGGLSLKPPQAQETMKYDMAGAASVLGVFKIVTDLALKVNLIVIVPSAENMPSGKAQRPGDIITMANGKTVEVLNTDAEGRLILGDALFHASTHFKPKAIVDVATLTGACAMAVGDAAAGIFTNDKKLEAQLMKAMTVSGENLWPLPDFDDFYADLLKSEVADLKNISKGRGGGASTAAIFLRHFIENQVPWAHLDIAGCGWYDRPRDFVGAPGASGVPVRLLFEYVAAQA